LAKFSIKGLIFGGAFIK
jgi:hypothetical protein